MTDSKAKRAPIHITESIQVEGWMLDQAYYMSGSDATKVIDKHRESLSEWLASKAAQSLPAIDKSVTEIVNPEGKGGRVTLFTLTCIGEYWMHWTCQGNTLARSLVSALMGTDLYRLYDIAFLGQQQSESVYTQQRDEIVKRWRVARGVAKSFQQPFQEICLHHHYPVAQVHDRMTKQISNLTAAEARLLPLNEGEERTGLNHYPAKQDIDLMYLAISKQNFISMEYLSDWRIRVDRAVDKALKKPNPTLVGLFFGKN